MSYVDSVMTSIEKKYKDQPEFLQAVTEVFESLAAVINKNEENKEKKKKYKKTHKM